MAHIDLAAKPATLRAELKDWERAFAATHGGKKAGRDDIKKDSAIGMLCTLCPLDYACLDSMCTCN